MSYRLTSIARHLTLMTTLSLLTSVHLAAASAADLIAEVDRSLKPEELEEAGNTARASALAAFLKEDLGLPPLELFELRLACAGAWLEAGRLVETRQILLPVFTDKNALAPIRERAGLMWVAAWQAEWRAAEKPGELPAAAVVLAPLGDLGPAVAARACTAEAQRVQSLDQSASGAHAALLFFDRALDLLKNQPPASRVPVYALRIAAMERSGLPAEQVKAWCQARATDTAATLALETALTAGQKQLGIGAPPLKLPRLDGTAGLVDIATFKGKPVLVDFFATWCKPCADQAGTVVAAVQRFADRGLVVIGVSLDTKESLSGLPAWIAKYGITYPVIGEKAGWDGETDDAWHVDAIPALILVGPDGTVVANDLIGENREKSLASIAMALDQVLGISSPMSEESPAAKPAAMPAATPDPGDSFVP